ncbi:MAG TPA: methyltransferase [Polyangia bacterium]|nr:methyltransferase [Polyangia bacterium]
MSQLLDFPPHPSTHPLPSVPRRPLPAPTPTDAVLTPRAFPSAPPAFAIRAVLWLRRRLVALADRVLPAEVAIFERSLGLAHTQLLGVAARHGVADLLAGGPLDAGQIASRCDANADAMHRVLRALASTGVFELRADGHFANNRLSRAMIGGRLTRIREWLQYISSQSNVAAWSDLERSVLDGKNAFERVFGMNVWEWFERHPDEREMFAQTMMGMTVADAPAIARLYPFGEVGTLCDVGGGRGTLLSEILIRFPRLRGLLVDSPGVLESARVLLGQRRVLERVTLAPGNFFEAVPPGADAYLLKNVLHDWDDERCRAILRVVRRAMRPGQRLILCESLLERNDASGLAPMADAHMLIVCADGRERSVAELHQLMRDAGFEPARVFPYPTVSVLEARAI